MKFARSCILAMAVAAAFVMPTVSSAANGTITITGQISAQTCTINAGTADSSDITLTQCAKTDSVSTSSIAKPASVDAATNNQMNSNSTAGTDSVSTLVVYMIIYQ